MSTILIDGNNLLHRVLNREQNLTGKHSLRMLYTQLITMNQFTLWVWDGYNSRVKRASIYPEYKNHRPEPSENVYAMFKLWEELLTYTNIPQIKVPEWEADDVIYTLCQELNGQGEIIIDTNDADYLQIPGVKLPHVTKPDFPYDYIRAYKAMMGDKSDNIPGMPRFGDGSWMKMQPSWDNIDDCLRLNDWHGWQQIPWSNFNRACLDKGNFDQCVMFYKIITMMAVPSDDIDKHMFVGKSDPAKAEALLRKYML